MRGDGQNQLKISAPHPITETYPLIPLLASLISLDSPFKKMLTAVNSAFAFPPVAQSMVCGEPAISPCLTGPVD
jgi:hypothetical protein